MSRQAQTVEFLQMCARGEVREAYARHVADDDFIHHNPWFPGDRESLLQAMEASAASEPNKLLDVRQVFETDDRVAVFSRLERADGGAYAVVHIARFRGDRIVELWDVVQAVPEASPNRNGMF